MGFFSTIGKGIGKVIKSPVTITKKAGKSVKGSGRKAKDYNKIREAEVCLKTYNKALRAYSDLPPDAPKWRVAEKLAEAATAKAALMKANCELGKREEKRLNRKSPKDKRVRKMDRLSGEIAAALA